jgi:hypothetical protein
MRLIVLSLSAFCAACTSTPNSSPQCSLSLPDGGTTRVTGTVTSQVNGASVPVPHAMIAVEYGGLYIPYCDLSHASPFYVFGTVADQNGSFALDVQPGSLGFHSYANGQFYGRASLDTSKGSKVTISTAPLGAQPKPTLAKAAFDTSAVSVGATVRISAIVHAGTSSDPLSDEVVVIEPTQSWAAELDPPTGGKKDDFSDGTWSRTFAAPAKEGKYTYWLEATSAGCATSDLVQLTLEVH